ncbi:MAG: ATP synthase subunit alpha [Candidatus Woesebacteria bacterium GW2011_GWB1_41_10]|uniref:ATP synthase subunit alpha n=1 Tax=Candidatus Woesebacteria bacterium GW2011_GWB1_41_10 TaxID=1618577 RepID=A0A0G0XDJ7_9BACT|nr:MAG: ATP synthase subunit alpha [Candidatus Woesebacteria bacterium GW2011_GWB1_41_10]
MIHSYKYCIEKNKEIGRVEQIKGPLLMVSGFKKAFIGEGVTFESGEHGEILSIKKDSVEVLAFSRNPINPNAKAGRSGEALAVSAGEGLLGHVVDALGYTLDDMREDSIVSKLMPIEVKAKGISERRKVDKFLETGVSIVDLVVPLGMGQRELVIGDRKTGKTSFLLQAVLSQAKKGTVCIYTTVGKRKSEIREIYDFLKTNDVLKYSIIVAASAEDSPGEVYIAPFTAMTLAEYFRDQGTDTLVIFDDLTTHAKYYREISLVGGRFPGRESYPGDIFYLHSKLLERAGNFKEASITCLPVAEAPAGDITGYIQTNLMSMTDGHLYFDSDLFFAGRRPAVNVFLSVTRVGKQTQTPEMRDLGREILLLLKKNEEMSRFLKFGPEVTPQVAEVLKKGKALYEIFNQMPEELRLVGVAAKEAERITGK